MPRDHEAFAEMVVLTVKAALAPLLERLAASEQSNKELQGRVAELSVLRDRVVSLETKSAIPVAPVEPAPVDLGPLLERIASTEARLGSLPEAEKAIGELRDRVLVVETKAEIVAAAPSAQAFAGPTSADVELLVRDRVEPLTKQIDIFERRLTAVESKPEPVAVAPIESTGPTAAETELALRDKIEPLTKQLSAISERVAVMEVRAPMPGPVGADGKNGHDGKDGVDGLGFDDLIAVQTDERTFTVKAQRGDRVKDIGTLQFPVEIYRGVFVEGKSYERGDCVTFGGSEFHCNEATTTKPEQSKAWTLKVKRGRDGRDGRDALGAPPVVTVGGRA